VKHPQTPVVEEIVFPTTSAVQELDEEPLYVNAKQYHRILKRRLARARLAEIQKLSTQRKVRWSISENASIYPILTPL
jgi:hypothetical protein